MTSSPASRRPFRQRLERHRQRDQRTGRPSKLGCAATASPGRSPRRSSSRPPRREPPAAAERLAQLPHPGDRLPRRLDHQQVHPEAAHRPGHRHRRRPPSPPGHPRSGRPVQTATDASAVTTSAPRLVLRPPSARPRPGRGPLRATPPARRATTAATPRPPRLPASIANPHSPSGALRLDVLPRDEPMPIPRRFKQSRASGVTTVPGATRTSPMPAAKPLGMPQREQPSRKHSLPDPPALPHADRPTSARAARTAASTCLAARPVHRVVGQPQHAPAARRRPPEQLLQATPRHSSPAPHPRARPEPVEREHRLAVGPPIGRLRAARPASARPETWGA